jgi:hypothetical protein
MDADDDENLKAWLDDELADSFDEELEMEIDDLLVAGELRDIKSLVQKETMERRV